jgi:hypothetical protein
MYRIAVNYIIFHSEIIVFILTHAIIPAILFSELLFCMFYSQVTLTISNLYKLSFHITYIVLTKNMNTGAFLRFRVLHLYFL